MQKYMNVKMLIEDLGFLKVVIKNAFGVYIYMIDVETVERYVSEHMKEKLRQLTLLDLRLREEEWLEKFSVCAERLKERLLNAKACTRTHKIQGLRKNLFSTDSIRGN